jgi:hypothetical protein
MWELHRWPYFRLPESGGNSPRAENAHLRKNGTTLVQAFGIGELAERVLMHQHQPAVVSKEIPFSYAVSRVHR